MEERQEYNSSAEDDKLGKDQNAPLDPMDSDGQPDDIGSAEAGDYDVEKEWADRLGIHFDPASVPPPPAQNPEAPGQPEPFMHTTPPMPTPTPAPPRQPMPPTYMVWAILATICCCLPAGIVAIVYSSTVSSKYYAHDYEGARRASERAEIWIIAAIVAGVIVNALYMPLSLMMNL